MSFIITHSTLYNLSTSRKLIAYVHPAKGVSSSDFSHQPVHSPHFLCRSLGVVGCLGISFLSHVMKVPSSSSEVESHAFSLVRFPSHYLCVQISVCFLTISESLSFIESRKFYLKSYIPMVRKQVCPKHLPIFNLTCCASM